MAVLKSDKPTRVFVNDIDITEYVRGYSVVTEDSVEITIFAESESDLAGFIRRQVEEKRSQVTNIEWRQTAMSMRLDAVMEGTATHSSGETETFNVLGIEATHDGWFIFYCDIPPHIPDGLIFYDQRPVRFRRGKVW